MKYCTKCLTPDIRPRVTFNEQGVCNACQWAEEKKTFDWKPRQRLLQQILQQYRKSKGFDVIVPVSGGKDGSYVAWKFKHELRMHPLCVTFSPPTQTDIGRKNLENFRNAGFDLLEIRPDPVKYKELCRKLFVEQGRSKFPFVIGIGTAISQIADKFQIPLVIWGEEGETEYGGSDKYKDMIWMDYDFFTQIYHEGIDLKEGWWKRLSKGRFKHMKMTWWSKFEDWDPEVHARFASEKLNLQMSVGGQIGTFTNYAQLDDALQDLHMFECFIKFGYGRATADCNIEIREGRMTREEALEVVKQLDGQFPVEYLPMYCEYFGMTTEEFWATIEKHVNWNILQRSGLPEKPYILKEDVYNNLYTQGGSGRQEVIATPPQIQ